MIEEGVKFKTSTEFKRYFMEKIKLVFIICSIVLNAQTEQCLI